MELIDFQGSKWVVKAKVDGSRLDDPSTLKQNYGADMVIKNSQNVYFVLDKVIDVEFEELK
tara:strand:- start:390 stop:572 length:183 start_codon:yes stop_codon:yes gene_type:complete